MKKIVLSIILFIISIPLVSAKEVNLVRERISDITTYYYDPNEGTYRYLLAQKFLLGESIGYCLEIGKDIFGTVYTGTESFDKLDVDKSVLEKIQLIAYYGYDYPGHNTDKYYMATQELIWRAISNPKISWIEDLTPSKVISVENEKEEIQKLIDTHYKKPSFDNTEIDYSLGKELILKDSNSVLERYTTDDKNIVINGNELILTENFDSEEIILKKKNYTGNSFFLYTRGTSQKMMTTGVVDDVESKIKVNISRGTIEIIKLDKDTKSKTPTGEATLDGATYEIYNKDNVLVDTIITGSKNKIENLPIGKYIIKEKTPSKGYVLDEEEHLVEITKENLDIVKEVYEKVITRKVEIFKVFANNTTGELLGEPQISFEIYNKDDVLVDTITTDELGYANIVLPYGTYTFKQINSTKDYYLLEDFQVTISESNDKPIHKLLSNSQITAKVKIIKKDLETKNNILNSNIKFKIYDTSNKKYLSLKVSYPENKVTEEFTIDKNGIFITPVPLPPGKYILEEIKENMNGYLYNSEKIPFEIGETSNLIEEDNELYLEIPFYNKRVKGKITINKLGEKIEYKDNSYAYKEIPLTGVSFNLYSKEDIYENGKLIYKKEELIREEQTNENGQIIIENLPLGEYYIKEINTLNEYILDNKKYDISLKYKDEDTEIITNTINIKNNLKKGNITINKYDTDTKKPIPNTLIEIRTKDNKIIYTGYTNHNGKIILKDLPYGEYYLSEVQAEEGYRLLEDKINFQINKDEEIINIYNERIKVPNTGYTLNKLDIYILITTLIGVLLVIIFPKEKRSMLISIIIIILGITYFITKIYNYHSDNKNNEKSVTAYINNELDVVKDKKYQYSGILEIPSINLKRGVLDINNTYNDAKYNIELVKETDTLILLAAHNGNNKNSYFKDLKNLSLGDEIIYYQDGILYKYIYTDSYDIKKDGYADIYRKEDIKSIILITCKDNTDDMQTVHIAYLKDKKTY